jgi:hypothetical protein
MRCPALRLPRSSKLIISMMAALAGIGSLVLSTPPMPAATLNQPAGQGTLWVFAVGVSHYRNSMIDLQFADNDAQTLAAALDREERGSSRKLK